MYFRFELLDIQLLPLYAIRFFGAIMRVLPKKA